jgi:predicted nucleic acid-binding protein
MQEDRFVRLVVDANILYSGALMVDGWLSDVFFNTRPLLEMCVPALLRHELMRHRPRMAKGMGATIAQVNQIQDLLLARITLFDISLVDDASWKRAAALVREVDKNDEDYVALALHLKCPLWTDDKRLTRALAGSAVECLTDADIRKR